MSLKTATQVAQNVMAAEFEWTFDDTMVNSAGNTVDFGEANAGGAAGIFEVIELPPGAVVVGGSLMVTTAFDTAGYDVTVGDATTANRYLASTDVKGLGNTALVPTGFVTTGEPIRVAFASDDVCTTGAARLTVLYVIDGRVNEVL